MMIGFGNVNVSTASPKSPTSQNFGDSAAIARPPSSGTTGSRLKRLRNSPVNTSAYQKSSPRVDRDRPQRERAERPEDRAREADARLGGRVVAERLRHDDGAEERDEHRRARRDALAAQLDDVAHLVDEQEQDEAERELPAPDEAVGGDRDEHRARGREDLRALQQDEQGLAELEQRASRRATSQPREAPPHGCASCGMPGRVLRGRVAAGRSRRRTGRRSARRAGPPRVGRCRPLSAHGSIVATRTRRATPPVQARRRSAARERRVRGLLGLLELRLDEVQAAVPEAGVGEVDADDLAELLRAARAAGAQQLEVARARTTRPRRRSACRSRARTAYVSAGGWGYFPGKRQK